MKLGVCQFSPTRHKSVTIATFFERAVAIGMLVMKWAYCSIFVESLAKINPGILVKIMQMWVFSACVHCIHPSLPAHWPQDLGDYETKVQEIYLHDDPHDYQPTRMLRSSTAHLLQLEPRDRFSRFMAQMTRFSPRMVLFGVRTMSDIIWGKFAPKTPQKGAWIGIFKPN